MMNRATNRHYGHRLAINLPRPFPSFRLTLLCRFGPGEGARETVAKRLIYVAASHLLLDACLSHFIFLLSSFCSAPNCASATSFQSLRTHRQERGERETEARKKGYTTTTALRRKSIRFGVRDREKWFMIAIFQSPCHCCCHCCSHCCCCCCYFGP